MVNEWGSSNRAPKGRHLNSPARERWVSRQPIDARARARATDSIHWNGRRSDTHYGALLRQTAGGGCLHTLQLFWEDTDHLDSEGKRHAKRGL